MDLKGWQEIPIGGIILEAGNAMEYRTGGWRAFRPVRGEAERLRPVRCGLPRQQQGDAEGRGGVGAG